MTQNRAEQDIADDSGPVEYDDIAAVQSVSSCTDGTDCYKIFKLHFGVIPILSIALTSQLQLWQFFGWFIHSLWRLYTIFTETKHISVGMASTRTT
jgi:hypothetical protein